jgi:hypothetical protein
MAFTGILSDFLWDLEYGCEERKSTAKIIVLS